MKPSIISKGAESKVCAICGGTEWWKTDDRYMGPPTEICQRCHPRPCSRNLTGITVKRISNIEEGKNNADEA